MRKYSDKEIKQIFETLGLSTDNEKKLLFRSIDQPKQTNSRIIITAGTSSKFVYMG